MKTTPNVKNLVLSHPLEDLGVTYTVNRWIDGKRIVDFLLAIIQINRNPGHDIVPTF